MVKELLEQAGYDVLEALVLPDGIEPLAAELCRLADQRQINLILTTGGTGLSPRDLTPEATKKVSDREVPGIGEALRAYSMRFTDRAMLSRQTAGIRKRTLIVNLPGSPLSHGLGILRGTQTD